jgi:ketosteroid isomerase-like protein
VNRILLTALMLTISMASVDRKAAAPRDDGDALIQLEHRWNDALKNHDVHWFEKNLAEDFTDTSSGNGALSAKADDLANLKTDKTVYESLELSNLRARIEGNAGVVTGVNHINGYDEQGQTFEVRLAFTDTYIRRHGRWLAWASQHTRVRP